MIFSGPQWQNADQLPRFVRIGPPDTTETTGREWEG